MKTCSKCEALKKEYRNGLASFDVYAPQLDYAERVQEGANGELFVHCAYCGAIFVPTISAVKNRISAINGRCNSRGAEKRLYCSDACRFACTYRIISAT